MKLFRATSAALIAATLGTAAAPAAAQWYPGYGYGYGTTGHYGGYRDYDRRYRRGTSVGDVIAGVAVIGTIAAIASAAAKSGRRDRDYGYGRDGIRGEREAADACTVNAERRYGAGARATVDDVFRTRDGYTVRGVVEPGYNGNYRDRDESFRCEVRFGRIDDIRFGGRY